MRLTVACFSGALLCGCAHAPEELPDPEKAPLAPIGVARVDTRTDVVTVLAHLDYVLYPNNTVTEPPVDKPAPQAVALSSPVTPVSTPTIPTTPSSFVLPEAVELPPVPITDEASVAWLKLCHGEELSAQEWAVIDSTPRPPELDKVWDQECNPTK